MLIIFDLDDTLYDRTGQVPDNYSEEDIRRITLFPGVKEFLQSFSGKKILVTNESNLGLQNKKIDALGIRSYFNDILICHSAAEKKECFSNLQRQFPQEEVWVVGDRVDLEIKYGKELGMKTVWLRHGNHRERGPREAGEVPDHQINEFSELAPLFPQRQQLPP